MEALKTNKFATITLKDSEIVKRILIGEKELFEILMRRNNQKLYRVVRTYISKEDDVLDVLQEAYIKAYLKLEQFNGNAAFSTWLIRIGINEALQFLRKRKRLLQKVDMLNDNEVEKIKDTKYMNPESQIINTEHRMLIENAIDRLPEKYRIIFMLHQVEGMSNSEIAACLSISDDNVKVRLHRAKKYLKEELYKLSADVSVFEFGNYKCDRLVTAVMSKL
ncbi:RNA polymerase sigma factor [Ulvibacter antarcticus]|uniref:RNA polymerase sigma factor n=1 Tax=Ulvibacter antarcticus TaxID=442714 RepID=A0A3L9YDD3_9FLAO|nr:RNA polymerase sigma factor [Ulvibacter antarcticus]RMA57049.1 RNA polymerase sigma-70 factor (ECF subfamily) [Ulvibacter antarcticus]